MKALSLIQPWATLVAIGAKKIETRSWPTSFRGPLAIHASKGFPRDDQELCDEEPFYSALEAADYYRAIRVGSGYAERPWSCVLPIGAVVATARLVDCLPITERYGAIHVGGRLVREPELSFGSYQAGRWGWLLADVVPLPSPVPASGALGLWNWEPAPVMEAAR